MGLIDELVGRIRRPVRMVFLENNANLNRAIERAESLGVVVPIRSDNMENAAGILKGKMADALVAGADMTSRDVIMGLKEFVGVKDRTFTSTFIFEFSDGYTLTLADAAVCKDPDAKRLSDIVVHAHDIHKQILAAEPRVAMLSYSTFGSGGEDKSIEKIKDTIAIIKKERSDIVIDGEMQLDAALSPEIGGKKAQGSLVAGRANVLIAPDLNSGNLLYKSIELFSGAKAYGPLLSGFRCIASDLSRGSTAEDIYGTIIITAVRAYYAQNAGAQGGAVSG